MKRILWVWCWAAFHTYQWLPVARDLDSRYGRFSMWLLEYGGAYAHSEDYRWFRDNAFTR